jgi:hypothetical protein
MTTNDQLSEVSESGDGRLYETNGFLIPVLDGSHREMGRQYGVLMKDAMEQAFDVVMKPGFDAGKISDEDAKKWTQRAVTTFSTRNKEFYAGMADGSGWPLDKVGILDQFSDFGRYQQDIHAAVGCTSIFSWGSSSADGNMYIGRNMDWSNAFNTFPQVLAILNPTDGSYRYANLGWPGMISVFTAINEHGVYMDLHDGTSMGGTVLYEDRAPFLQTLSDMLAETASLEALVRRFNSSRASWAVIMNLADGSSAASMECATWDNRVRLPEGDSLAAVNTFLNPDWGIHAHDTMSHSLERFDNMTARLADNHGSIDAAKVRDLMDLTLYNEDGSFTKDGGATKPTKIDADQTTHQMVTDVSRREVWLKIPNPKYKTDWIPVDLKALWA